MAFALLSVLTAGCVPQPSESMTYIFRGPTMGTSYSVKLITEEEIDEEAQAEIRQAITQKLEQINASMSTYLPDSEVSRFNAHDGPEPFPISGEAAMVIRTALEIGRWTGGAFDITVAPLVNAWGFGPELETPPVLPEEQINAILAEIGIEHVQVSEDGDALVKEKPELSLDLSGIAKGYAVDQVIEVLTALGFENVLVDVGGEARALGRNPGGEVWRLGIERPQANPLERAVQMIVPLADLALATSGDYRNYREFEGERFSHILDPRDGRPIRHRLASVSVVHEQCMMADAWATALMVLGAEAGLELASEHELAAFFLVRDDKGEFESKSTLAFDRLRGITSN